MNRTNIDWPGLTHTWNPITGCRRQCSYCYAAKIWCRFNKTTFTDIVLHPDRLKEPLNHKKPAVIFVGSMSDIQYWSIEQKRLIVGIARQCPQHTFMFLSKRPESYAGIEWPDNCMQGLTIEKMDKTRNLHIVISMGIFPRPYLSIEPLLGFVESTKWFNKFETIIVGTMTGRGAIKPEKEWVQSVLDNIPKEKLFLKDSMKRCIKAYGLQ